MFGERTDKMANAANLIVTVAACAVDPTGLALTGAAVNGTLSLNAIFKNAAKDAKALTAEITKTLTDSLADQHISDDARVLLPQMLDGALPSPADLTAENLNTEAVLDLMVARLTEFEHRQPTTVKAFRDWLRPSFARLLADPTFITAIGPQIARETLNRLQDLADSLLSLSKTYQTLAGALDHLSQLRRKDLEALAFRFGLSPPLDAPVETLLPMIEAQAAAFQSLQAQIAAIDHRIPALHNLKAAAQDAANNLDFAQVESLIAVVDQIETETAAETKELRAANLLLMNNPDAAYRHFQAAGNSFAAIDPMETIRRRDGYAATLYNHGQRFGGTGLLRAIDLWQINLTDLSQTENPQVWAGTQNNLAVALGNQAARVQGAAGADLLAQAVAAYRQALQVYSRKDHPVHWAATQNNLANALGNQAKRVEGAAGAGLLAQAVAAYRQALQVRTRENHPVQWAMTQNNLAVTLSDQAARVQGAAGADLLAQAIAAYRLALQVRTRKDHPVDWAATQNNLAVTLSDQAARVQGAAGTGLLAQAVAAYRQALKVRTRKDHPVDWAGTQNNLANALGDQAARVQGTAGADFLAQAVSAYEQALLVRTREDQPVQWAMTMENLAIVHLAIARHPITPNPEPHLRDALSHAEAALTVFDPIHMAPNHSKAMALRADILKALQSLPKR